MCFFAGSIGDQDLVDGGPAFHPGCSKEDISANAIVSHSPSDGPSEIGTNAQDDG